MLDPPNQEEHVRMAKETRRDQSIGDLRDEVTVTINVASLVRQSDFSTQ